MIYFLRHIKTGIIKIGRTNAYDFRHSELSKGFGELSLLGWVNGGRGKEDELHRLFSKYNVQGTLQGNEWFSPSDEILAYIRDNANKSKPQGSYTRDTVNTLPKGAINNLSLLIEKRGVTSADVSRATGISNSALLRLAKGQTASINMDIWKKLSDYFGVNGHELFDILPETD